MARQQKSVSVPFPVLGLADLGPYENQPNLTTPLARNVRAFAFTGDTSDESKRGRMSGGQRAGMALYHPDRDRKFSVGAVTDCSIQDITHIAGHNLEPIVGTNHWFLNRSTGSSGNNLQTWKNNAAVDVDSIGNAFTVLATAYGRSNVGWAVVLRDTTNAIDLLRLERDLTAEPPPWKYTSTGSVNTVTLASTASVTCHGVVAYGDYVFVWIRDPAAETEKVYKVKAGTTLTKVEAWGSEGEIENTSDGGVGVGKRGWNVVGGDIGDTLLAVSNGTVAMLTRYSSGNDVQLFQKSAESGENISVATLLGTVTGEVYCVVPDKRGIFWVACCSKGTGRSTGLFSVARGSSTFDATPEMTPTPSDDPESSNECPRSLAYDGKNDRVYVAGLEGVCGITDARSLAAVHAYKAELRFMSDSIDDTNNRFKGFRSIPFNEGDKITLSVPDTSTLPAGLASGGVYYVTGVVPTDDGLIAFKISASRAGTALTLSATATSTDVWTFTRATGERVYWDAADNTTPLEFQPAGVTPSAGWDSARMSTNGGVNLSQAAGTGTVVSLSPTNLLGTAATAGSSYNVTGVTSPFKKMGRNAVENVDPSGRVTSRSFTTLVTALGTIKKLTAGGFESVKDADYKLKTDIPVIFSAPYGNRVYYVDGLSSIYYDSAHQDDGEEGAVVDWDVEKYSDLDIQGEQGGRGLTNVTAGQTKGDFPIDADGNKPRLVTVWNSRLVLSGLVGEPQNWFMSRRDNPNDFDYFVQPFDDEIAAAGNLSPAGLVPDKVNTLIPYNDDILIFGCDHSIFQLSGDPAAGGAIDLVTDVTGMVWGHGWCKDPSGVLYFFGSRGGVFRMGPGTPPQSITSSTIDERLAKLDLSVRSVRMVWNDREHGVNLFLSHVDPTEQVEHYFFDARANSWWEDRYEAKETDKDKYVHNATAYHVIDGDKEGDREILVGGRNGAIYKISIKEQDDRISTSVNKEIDSFVWLGPFSLPDGRKVVLTEISALLAHDSGDVDYGVYVGSTAEFIIDLANDALDTGSETTLNKNRRFDGTFAPDRRRTSSGPIDRRRAIAHDIFVRLRNNTAAEDWAFEKMIIRVGAAGVRSSRGHEVGKRG